MNNELINVLNSAIINEKDGIRFYLTCARKTESILAKNMFINLAKDEWHHMYLLEKEFDTIRKVKREDELLLKESDKKRLFPDFTNISKIVANKTDSDALKIAIENELKAKKIYEDAAKEANNLDTKSLLEKLADEEDGHYNILVAELDSIKKTGFWCDYKEISLEVELDHR